MESAAFSKYDGGNASKTGIMNSNNLSQSSRRKFLQTTALAAAAASPLFAAEEKKSTTGNSVCVFNKPLQHLSYEEQAKLVAEMGFAGIEGTVRKGGHVVPEKVKSDLPKQIKALRDNQVDMTLMTTDINNADDAINRDVLETAAGLGVKRFRMRPYKYDYSRPLPEQLKEFGGTYEKLVEYCTGLGIRPLYQNHAGAKYFGASLWDLYLLMKDLPVEQVGICFDIRHATAEGGLSWPTQFHLMRPFFGFVYCKDFLWDVEKKKPYNVPLGTGMVNYPQFFSMLKRSGYDGPISLHMEYKDHRDPALQDESIKVIREDMSSLQKLMADA